MKEYRTPALIIHQVEIIRKFQQNNDEPLFAAWERFKEALLKYPEHKLNKYEQLQIFYNGLNIATRRMLDFKEPIPKMIANEGLKKIEEIAQHSATWHEEQTTRVDNTIEVQYMLKNLEEVESDMLLLTGEVKMVQHSFNPPLEGRVTNLEKEIKKLMKETNKKQYESEKTVWELKKEYDSVLKNQAAAIRRLESQVGKLAESVRNRDNGELRSTTETNPRDLAHAITTRSGLNYKEPAYPSDSENRVNRTPNVEDKNTTEENVEHTKPTKKFRPYIPPIPFPG